MIQSHIFLTHTHIDNDRLSSIIAHHYFEKNHSSFRNLDFTPNKQTLEKTMEMLKNQQRIKMVAFDSKKDYRDEIMSLYRHYDSPFLLFLGNISDYSIQLQEGMLRLLEEPPDNLIIILFAHSRSQILPTISSRSVIYTLEMKDTFSILHTNFSELAKKKLTPPLDVSKELISNRFHYSSVKDISKIDREVIGLWLWQVNMYLSEIYKTNSALQVSQSIKKVLQAIHLNEGNAQKKFVLAQLSI
jgi:DNA polymerase III delta prime subunit